MTTIQATAMQLKTVTELLAELYKTDFEQLFEETKQLMSDNRQAFFLSNFENKAVGVAHVSLRSEYVNGTKHSGTCGYLEGIFVQPEFRKNGIAAHLLQSCENWAKQQGCREFASDCLLENTDSRAFHLKMGFTETERCIFFRKEI